MLRINLNFEIARAVIAALLVADIPVPAKVREYAAISMELKSRDEIFYPFKKDDDAIIIERKVNHTADEAIQQIKDRQNALRFEGSWDRIQSIQDVCLRWGLPMIKRIRQDGMSVRWRC